MQKAQLILFFRKALLFLCFYLLVDFILGSFAESLFFSQKTGKFARLDYSLNKAEYDMYVFGNSHANRHYVPEIFQNKLHISCYNLGVQGHNILLSNAMEHIILKRSNPKLIILNVEKKMFFEKPEIYDRLDDLHPFYKKYPEEIGSLIALKSKLEVYKLGLKSFRFNSTLVHVLKYYFLPQPDQGGYSPLFGTMNDETIRQFNSNPDNTKSKTRNIDDNFVEAFQQFVEDAEKNHVQLILVSSPTYSGITYENESSVLLSELIKKKSLVYLDFSDSPEFLNMREFFYDPTHLNNTGAKLFSAMVADSVRSLQIKKTE